MYETKTVTWQKGATEAQIKAFVAQSEAYLTDQWDAMLASFANSDCKVYTLSGPTCSGKTTTAHLLDEAFTRAGKRVEVISIDDFFASRPSEDERYVVDDAQNLDYDSIDALDLPLFAQCAHQICQGKDCELPIFDFHTGQRKGYRTLYAKDYDIALFEGIQAIYPEITAILKPYGMTAIATGVQSDAIINGIHFDRRQIRLMRRVVRDVRKRSAPAEFTLRLWNSVAANEEKSIFPYEHTADVRIDSFLSYEVFVLRDPLLSILKTVPQDSQAYQTAKELIEKLEPLPSLPESVVPKQSMYWEFL